MIFTKRGLLLAGAVGALSLGLAGPAQAATPVAVWHMGNSGTVMVDATGNNNQGTLRNVTTGESGDAGRAFGFHQSPSVVTVRDSAGMDPGNAALTVRAHVKFSVLPSALVGDYDLVRKGLAGSAGGDWKMEIRQNGRPYCTFRGSVGRVTLSTGTNLADGGWHTVTCKRRSGSVVLTVDGSSITKAGVTGSINNSSPVFIGAKSASGGDQYNGLLDEVSLSVG